MTQIERRIRTTQRRLSWNRWFNTASWCFAMGGGLFALVVLVQRLFDMSWPLFPIAQGLGAFAIISSIIWAVLKRDDAESAAAELDQAAGLKERLSSGHFCLGQEDPFKQAVVYDAERISSALSVRSHIPLRFPRPFGWTAGSILLAAMMFLITPGLLKSTEAMEGKPEEKVEQTEVAVKRRLDKVRELAEQNPVFEDIVKDLDKPDTQSGGQLKKAGQIRHEAIKKIDRLEDAVKQKRRSADYEAVKRMRKMFRRLKQPKSSDAPTQKLTKALNNGDFQAAKEEIKSLREQLATLKADGDKAMVKKISKQLDDLAKQLEKLAVDKNLAKKLEQAGVKKEDLKRMLENLSKKDLDQLKKQLQEKGWNQKQIQKLAKKLQQQQKAGSLAKKLANAMKNGGQSGAPGQSGQSMSGLSQAGEMLSELEMLDSEMQQLDSVMAGLNESKNALDKPCGQCNGTGKSGGRSCSSCGGKGSGGPGRGMGKMGQGRGGLAPEQETNVAFKVERGKVHTGQGAIIGQILIDGEQVKGDVDTSLERVISAAERDASDRISRDRVPRQYQKAVRKYFSNMQEVAKQGRGSDAAASKNEEDSSSD